MRPDILPAFAAFTATAALITVTPGPDSALVLRSALRSGRRTAFMTGLGVSLGLMVWGLASAVGVAALLAASPAGFRALQTAGALWLVWLGARALLTARAEDPADVGPPSASVRQSFVTGLSTNLLNPKALVFYVSLLPQFLPDGAPAFPLTLLYALTHAALNVAWFGLLSWWIPAARGLLRRGSSQAWVERVTGVVLVGFGVKLASAAI
ncbi:LysE family translocator [Streptomyces roseirectus]|uniref:LysE family translocator n=1 Tax=Streptomyces roseirectus TaxID=2768066 RepID=A0A7H0I5Q2_9ACTN|nr:LysE family translocator [Streptomyces roseirectus]QNP68118.1 LysE family translocator [Streptomyces roseirectus]